MDLESQGLRDAEQNTDAVVLWPRYSTFHTTCRSRVAGQGVSLRQPLLQEFLPTPPGLEGDIAWPQAKSHSKQPLSVHFCSLGMW